MDESHNIQHINNLSTNPLGDGFEFNLENIDMNNIDSTMNDMSSMWTNGN
jgi:hypothetical protein